MSEASFRKLNLITIWAVYFLILVGGIVRGVGAGMGCPDWPKCFGKMVPPTSTAELPADYKERFLGERLEKNQKLAGMLSSLGMTTISERVLNDPMIHVEEDFSPLKAWVEYVNRLIGVVIGFCIIGTTATSFLYRRTNPKITLFAILSLILVVFQGWVGSLVVSTNLLPGFVSFHMTLALLLVALLIYTYYLSGERPAMTDSSIRTMSIGLFLMVLPQILLGTQVREAIDLLKLTGLNRIDWISSLAWPFYVHRSYSLLILILSGFITWRVWKLGWIGTMVGKLSLSAFSIIVLLAVGGAIMTYLAVPALVQLLHLILAALLFGVLFYLILQTQKSRTTG